MYKYSFLKGDIIAHTRQCLLLRNLEISYENAHGQLVCDIATLSLRIFILWINREALTLTAT